jgi:Tat protein secretion system quality control protein TatD with DNase activity
MNITAAFSFPGSVGNVTANAINNEKTNISPPDSLESQFATLLPCLPNPRPLSEVIVELRQNLSDFSASMLGEVGLDGGFRIYLDYFASPRHRTTFTIPLAHQVAILEAQIEVAVELGKNISMHSVRCEQATLELFDKMKKKFGEEKWNRISVDIHKSSDLEGYGGTLRDLIKIQHQINSLLFLAEET